MPETIIAPPTPLNELPRIENLPTAITPEINNIVQKIREPKQRTYSASERVQILDNLTNNDPLIVAESKKIKPLEYDVSAGYSEVAPGKYVPKYDVYYPGFNNEELHAQNQGAGEQWVNGLSKFAVKTGTAILGGTLGMVAGVAGLMEEGRVSAIWDNDFLNYMEEINKRVDNAVPNYVTEHEKNMGFLRSLGTANLWANDFLGGLAFMTGAIGSEAIWAAATGGSSLALRAAKIGAMGLEKSVLKKSLNAYQASIKASNIAGGLNNARFIYTSAGYEGAVESKSSLDESIANFQESTKISKGRNPTAEEYAEFMPDAISNSNKVFAANVALVGASNIAMYGKYFGVGVGVTEKIAKATNKLFGIGVNKIDDAGKIVYEAIKPSTALKLAGKTYNILKTPIREGLVEEGLQATFQKASQNQLAAKYDPTSLKENYGTIEAMSDAFSEVYTSKEGWKEIGIGMLIGGFGHGIGRATGRIKGYDAEVLDQKVLAGRLTGTQNTLTNATNTALRKMLDVNQQLTMTRKATEATEKGQFTQAAMYFDQAQFAKMQAENESGMLDGSLQNFTHTINNTPTDILAKEYGVEESEVKNIKEAMVETYAKNIKTYKLAKQASEALIPTIKDYKDAEPGKVRDLSNELALNIYLGVNSQERGKALESSVEELTGIYGIASHINFYKGLKNDKKNAVEAVRVATKRLDELNATLGEIQTEYSVLKETTPRTTENNQVNTRLEANRTKYAKTLGIITERTKQLEELKATIETNPQNKNFAFANVFETNIDPTSEQLLESLNQLDKLDDYITELNKTSPQTAQTVKHLIGEIAKNNMAYEQFTAVATKMTDQRMNFKSYKGLAGAFNSKIAKRYEGKKTKLTPEEQEIETLIAANNLDEYDAFGMRLLADLSAKVYTDDFTKEIGEYTDAISNKDWDTFVKEHKASDDVLNEIAKNIYEKVPLSNREERIREWYDDDINQKIAALKKEAGDALRKKRKTPKIRLEEQSTTTATLRKLISDISASKNYLEGMDINDVAKADIPTEDEYREYNKLEQEKLSAETVFYVPFSNKKQKRYEELRVRFNEWGKIEGTFSGRFKLGELYNQLFALEENRGIGVQDIVEGLPLSDIISEADLMATKGENYDTLQTYDKAFFSRTKEGVILVHNVSVNGLIENMNLPITKIMVGGKEHTIGTKINVETETQVQISFVDKNSEEDTIIFKIAGRRGNITIGKTEGEANQIISKINANSTIQIRPITGNIKLPTSYFTVFKQVIIDGKPKLIPLSTDFSPEDNEKTIEPYFNVPKIQNLKKNDILNLNIPLTHYYNKKLIKEYKKNPTEENKIILAKNMVINFLDMSGNLAGIFKAEYDEKSAKDKKDFQAVSKIRKEAVDKLISVLEQEKGLENVDLEMTAKIKHVYFGHPVLDIVSVGNSFEIINVPFTESTVEKIKDIGYIENGKLTLKNNTDNLTKNYVSSASNSQQYSNKRIPVVVIDYNGMNVVYPVSLIPTITDNSQLISDIMATDITSAEKAQKINEALIANGIDVEPLQIRGDNLTEEKINTAKELLTAQSKYVPLESWTESGTSIADVLINNASINIDLNGEMFHSPKVVIDLGTKGEVLPIESIETEVEGINDVVSETETSPIFPAESALEYTINDISQQILGEGGLMNQIEDEEAKDIPDPLIIENLKNKVRELQEKELSLHVQAEENKGNINTINC